MLKQFLFNYLQGNLSLLMLLGYHNIINSGMVSSSDMKATNLKLAQLVSKIPMAIN